MTKINGLIQSLGWNKRIEVLRIANGWTQNKAADECGTSQKVYWLWEKGLSSPRNNSRIAIAKAFSVSVEEIFGEQASKKVG